jgi:hypothetical protein
MIIVSKACRCFCQRELFAQRQRQRLFAPINVAKKHLKLAIAAGIGAVSALFIACQRIEVVSGPARAEGSYLALDTRLGWMMRKGLELSLAGFNLTARRHAEFGPAPTCSELSPTFYLKMSLNF